MTVPRLASRAILALLAPIAIPAVCLPSLAAEVEMKTHSWADTDEDFARFAERIASTADGNLLAHPGVVVHADPEVRDADVLADGLAGSRGAEGRAQVEGGPSVIAFYLGGPRTIRGIGVFTFNGDTRANQDYEVRLADGSARPGVRPTFPSQAQFTTGDKVIGQDRGGLHTCFAKPNGEPLAPGRCDWVEFRVWGTHGRRAGQPSRQDGGWTAVIELQVLGDPEDGLSREEIARYRKLRARRAARSRLEREYREAAEVFQLADPLRLAIEDLVSTFGPRYERGREYLARLDAIEDSLGELAEGEPLDRAEIERACAGLERLRQEALLANPLVDFDRLLLVRRAQDSTPPSPGKDKKKNRRKKQSLGLPQNWQGNCALPRNGFDNEIAVLSPVRPDGRLTTLFRPQEDVFVGDVDLHFDADRMLFSMPGGEHNRWQIWEVRADGSGLRQVTPGEEPDVDNYDACYLPDGRVVFASTRCFHGVPCVGGNNTVANLCLMDADGSNIRQLCFDQDHNWCPTVLNNGRVLYSRWEYSDTPHYFTRLLFHMNPDGTGQMEYYASNSLWPNSIFYARPIPNHPTKVVAVISGHHGVPRMGELVLFDPARGRHEAQGAVQRIPGHGKEVDPVIRDGLVNGSWPKFLHPYPLGDKYFLVSCQPSSRENWGIYLVDTFDNMLLLKELPGNALFEPLPLRKTSRPPVIADKVNLASDEATVYLSDVYFGRGLEDVPRGTVKSLRVYSPHYAYPRMGGHINIGIDGPWDARRILGTVPVEADGSASFKVPANLPIAVQPLDEKGRAVQVMRSWFTAMPGEVLSCVGCHESQNTSPPARPTLSTQRRPSTIEPWYGPARGFSFKREVQPVLDRYCVGCHDGTGQADGKPLPDFTARTRDGWRGFTPSYIALHPFVRRPGPESDYHLQRPMEYHASTSELVQMLEKGHHHVELDEEAWNRLITWIDLNVPDHGTWSEHRQIAGDFHQRRLEMRTRYANRPEDPEEILPQETTPVEFVRPAPPPERKAQEVACRDWPFDSGEARKRQQTAGMEPELSVEITPGVELDMVLVPAGEFVMGQADGPPDEYPPSVVKIEKPFYMGRFEVTNEQFAAFDPAHDSAYISVFNKDIASRGEPANRPDQPVIRINWQQANAFCAWLSHKTGKRFNLPTEAQWEYACRAGAATPMHWGACDADFGRLANLADSNLVALCRRNSPKWIPSIAQVNDGATVTQSVGKYEPNAWGLHDMHGNVSEWTRTACRPYPYDARDGRESPDASGTKAVRGGSFYDRPHRAAASFRRHYQPWQRVFHVGIRVVMEP